MQLEENSDLWVADVATLKSQNLDLGFGDRFLRILGWLNPQMFVASGYQNGGVYGTYMVSLSDRELTAATFLMAQAFWSRSDRYLPIFSSLFVGEGILSVIGQSPMMPPHAFEWLENTHRFPHENIGSSLDNQNFIFQNWQRDTPNMLMSWIGWEGSHLDAVITNASLMHWNVENDNVRLIAPGGIAGRYSPDSKLLASATLGPALPGGGDPFVAQTVSSEALPMLHLSDPFFETITFSIPGVVQRSELIPDYDIAAAFSPDSRYLAFLTPGRPQIDSNGKPIGLEPIRKL